MVRGVFSPRATLAVAVKTGGAGSAEGSEGPEDSEDSPPPPEASKANGGCVRWTVGANEWFRNTHGGSPCSGCGVSQYLSPTWRQRSPVLAPISAPVNRNRTCPAGARRDDSRLGMPPCSATCAAENEPSAGAA